MKDVQALAAAKSWNELIVGAENVPPASRTSEWSTLVAQAAANRLQELVAEPSNGSQAQDIVDFVTKSEKKYSLLLRDASYLTAKGKALASVVGFCTQSRAMGCAACLEALARGLTSLPKGTALKIALLMGEEDRFPSETLRYFAIAAEEDVANCKYGQLQNGVLTGLAGGDHADLVPTATKVAKLCYAPLEDSLVAQLSSVSKGSTYANNVCPLLKAHGKSSMAIRDKCP